MATTSPTTEPDGILGRPAELVADLFEVVPKLVERSHAQARLARSIASHLPCVGHWFARRVESTVPLEPVPEPIDVLSVVADTDDVPVTEAAPHGATDDGGSDGIPLSADPDPGPGPLVPSESDLAVPDYDSLAASQVVPRLKALSRDELEAVQRYEGAHRKRQTILNRIAQLLAR